MDKRSDGEAEKQVVSRCSTTSSNANTFVMLMRVWCPTIGMVKVEFKLHEENTGLR